MKTMAPGLKNAPVMDVNRVKKEFADVSDHELIWRYTTDIQFEQITPLLLPHKLDDLRLEIWRRMFYEGGIS